MDIANFKEILQKLSVFKNNLSLLVPIIIGLVSVLLFIPTQLMSSKLRANVQQESVAKIRTIEDMFDDVVPRDQWEREQERQKEHAEDANEIAALAVKGTQRALLSYDIFPDPNSSSTLIFQEFGQRFRRAIDELIVRVNGRDCPTDAELERGLENSSLSSRIRRTGGLLGAYGGRGTPRSLYGRSSGMGDDLQRMIVEQMCLERAESILVYTNPADLPGYVYWRDYKYDVKMEEAVEDCWYHQLAYWVIEDIFDTINAMNSGHESVLAAPVKRFLSMTFTMGLKRPGRRGGGTVTRIGGAAAEKTKENADKPSYVLSASEGLTESCTGRFSGEGKDVDVIHFNFSVVVGAKEVLPFIQQLCSAKEHKFNGYPDGLDQPQIYKHNQITVLESNIRSVDLQDMAHRYYEYGEDSVVELELVCEYIFNKEGYKEIKPESVKKTIKGEDEAEK